ncbi:Ig-like domain repeat protein [Paenibacillus sp. IB182496]|uniref:Ig-like domain repeat protein n=1 Tax=Paenibacillus sabuli TaxID=2772509 RepID=A0A927BW02_9BACL|nr:Ig-like domain repeat protein [Paenibacillus sabuli]MBD2847871.1 Ig-like domain repeat protein [Paenibacillus sabuli]
MLMVLMLTGLRRYGRTAGMMLLFGFLWLLFSVIPAHADTSLEVTNVYVEKEKPIDNATHLTGVGEVPYYYTYGEKIELMIEFNQPVGCTSGSIPMVLDNYGSSPTLNFQYAGKKDDQTAIFTFTVVNSGGVELYDEDLEFKPTDGGPLAFTLTIPCSGSGGTNYEVSGQTDIYNQLTAFIRGENAIAIDITPPQFERLQAQSGVYGRYSTSGYTQSIYFQARFDEPTIMPEDAVLQLNNGEEAIFSSYNGYGSWFIYRVKEGDDVAQLEVTDFVGTVTDFAGNAWGTTYDSAEHGLAASGVAITLDAIFPESSVTCEYCHTYTKNPEEEITATDVGSGLAKVQYEWVEGTGGGSGNWTDVGFAGNPSEVTEEALPPSGNVDGAYYLHVRVEDRGGNATNVSHGPYYFDNTPPAITASPSESAGAGGIPVTLRASDDAGVQSMDYRWDGGGWQSESSDEVDTTIPATAGTHVLEVRATDQIGNQSEVQTFGDYIVDDAAPVPNFSYTASDQPKTFHSVDITLEGNRADEQGTLYVMWTHSGGQPDESDGGWEKRIDGKLLPASWTETTPEGENGNLYLHVKTEDNLGNVERFTVGSAEGVSFLVDNIAPEVEFQPDGNNGVYASRAEIAVVVDDAISDAAQCDIAYLILEEGKSPEDYGTGDWLTSADGDLELNGVSGVLRIHVNVTDEAGNTTAATSKPFSLDHLPPQGAALFANGHGHTNEKQIAVNFTAADEGAVTAMEVRYAVEDAAWGDWLSYVQTPSATIDLDDAADAEGKVDIHVQYRDEAGNESEVYTIGATYDVTPPTITDAAFDPDGYTQENVTVTLSYTDNFTPAGTQDFQIEENGTRTLTVYDQAGNAATRVVNVDHIDRTSPVIQFVTNGNNHKQQAVSTIVLATDNASAPTALALEYAWSMRADALDAPEAWSGVDAGEAVELEAADGNWYLWVRAVDEAGNTRIAVSNSFWLDNTVPSVAEESFSPDQRTAMPVIATLTFSEPVYVSAPDALETPVTKYELTFAENGSVETRFADEAGNASVYTVNVDWIDTSLPTADVSRSTSNWTNQPVDVTVSVAGEPPRALRGIRGPDDAELIRIKTDGGDILGHPSADATVTEVVYRFHANGTLDFIVEDLETGLTSNGQAQVMNIDLQAPGGEIRYSTEYWTQEDVTVTLSVYDDSGMAPVIWSEGGDEIVFTENGEHTFRFRDAAGNETERTAFVDWIVRATPEPTVTFTPATWTSGPVTATLSFEQETAPIAMTNLDERTYTFEHNGTFTFRYADAAGNVGDSGPVTVDWIDREAPKGTLLFSERGWTNEDVTVSLLPSDNSGADVIFLNDGGSQHTFTENGSFTFTFRDAAGNENAVTAVVDRIDKTPPQASVRYSTIEPTNAPVRATIEPDEAGVQVVNNGGKTTYDFVENGNFTFILMDRAGNVTPVMAQVNHIVRDEPDVTVTYSTTEPTGGRVIARVSAADPSQTIYVTNNFRRHEYVFTENGSFTFFVQDEAGNRTTVEAVVTNIDTSLAEIALHYSKTEPTRESVTVTIASDRELTLREADGGLEQIFTRNETRWLQAQDALGNVYWLEITVDNIDREAPEVRYSAGEPLIIVEGEAFDPFEGMRIVDAQDGDLTSATTVRHSIDVHRAGEYELAFEAFDRAGNALRFTRPAQVIGRDALRGYVNGELPPSGTALTVRGYDIQLRPIGALGHLNVKWDRGFRAKGYFKSNGEWLDTDAITVTQYGYYTFLLQDQQRRYHLIHVYVVPE